ncbi:MAG: hypothetical protein R2834_00140 [Rhodothermales bacterium]
MLMGIAVLACAAYAVLPASAQTTLFPVELPALEVTTHVSYHPLNGAYLTDFTYIRLASPEELDPSSGGTGRVETVILSAGARSNDGTTLDFRWRAGLIDMDLVRTPLSMGLTLFDFNRTGWMDTDFRWVNLRLGPSVFLGSPRSFIALRAIGSAGLTTVKLGSFMYDGLGSEIRERRRSYELGYLGDLHILLWDRLSMQGIFAYRTMLGGGRPQFYRATGTIGARFSQALSGHLVYQIEEAHVGPFKRQQDGYGALIRFSF